MDANDGFVFKTFGDAFAAAFAGFVDATPVRRVRSCGCRCARAPVGTLVVLDTNVYIVGVGSDSWETNHMPNPSGTATLRGPSYIVGPEGEPTGVILDIATWRVIVAELEEREDGVTWREHSEAIEALARGERPPGWRELAEFERELDEAEARGDLPS